MTSLFDTPVEFDIAFRNYWKITGNLPHVGVLVGDIDGNHLYSNQAFRKMFYGTVDFDPVGKTIEELEGPEIARERLRIARQVCDTGRPMLIRHTRLGTRVESAAYPWKPNRIDAPPRHIVVFSRAASPADCPESGIDMFESEFNSWGELDELTDRQLEVLAALREGFSQKEAAKVLGVTAKTIETHRDQLVRRLGISSTLDAIRLADKAGLTLQNAKKRRVSERPWEQFRPSDSNSPPSIPQGAA